MRVVGLSDLAMTREGDAMKRGRHIRPPSEEGISVDHEAGLTDVVLLAGIDQPPSHLRCFAAQPAVISQQRLSAIAFFAREREDARLPGALVPGAGAGASGDLSMGQGRRHKRRPLTHALESTIPHHWRSS